MSNETDLGWLARNVHKWPEGKREVLVCWPRDVDTLIWSSVLSDAGWITKDQWLASRAELQEKPSWAHAPEWAGYMAQSPNGHWEFFAVKPRAEGWWRHPIGERSSANNASIRGAILGEWCDTLEKRPEEFKQFTIIEDNQGQDMTQQHDMKQDNGWFERGEFPPVGVWCEASGDGASPERCKIIAYHKGQVALQWEVFNGGCLDILELTGDYWKFRPIRTERDVLIEIIKKTDDTDDRIADAILAAGFSLRGK